MPGVVVANPVSSLLIDENGNKVGIILDGIVYRLQIEAKLATGHGLATEATLSGLESKDFATEATLDSIDQSINDLSYFDGNVVSGIDAEGIIVHGISGSREVLHAQVDIDPADGKRRLAIDGKVSVSPPPAPPGTTEVIISADSPLSMTGTVTTSHIIANGKIFHIQQLTAGAEGDPNEKGSKVEVYYYDGTTEHLVERVYIVGFTQFGIYPDTAKARDGTIMIGDGTTKEIRIKRNRLGGNALEVDAVVRGFEE